MLIHGFLKFCSSKKGVLASLFLTLIITCNFKKPPLKIFAMFPIIDYNKIVILENTDGLFTNEFGRQASFTVRLAVAPESQVSIGPVHSLNEAEGKVISNQYLIFDYNNYNIPQTVTVQGVDDSIADGNQTYEISLGKIETSDYSYSLLTLPNVRVINTDKDTASIAVSPTMGLVVNESGTKTSFSVILSTQPGGNVTIPSFSSSNPNECIVLTSSLTFNSNNWDTPQTVEVQGVDDNYLDGPQTCSISSSPSTSEDQVYVNKTIPLVTVTNVDNDQAGFTFVSLTPAQTTEAGGQAQFSIVMNTIPYGTVNITGITSNDPTEGTVSPNFVSFNSTNWNTPQIFVVTGVDDYMQDGDINYTLLFPNSTASDPNDSAYNGLAVGGPGSFTNLDDDIRGVIIEPQAPTLSITPLTITEGGAAQTFRVKLSSVPCDTPTIPETCNPTNVTISFTNSNPTEYTVSPTSLTFTPLNWNVYQIVTVTAIDDYVDEEDITYILTVDPIVGTSDYSGYDPNDITISLIDNDTAGFTVTPAGGVTVNENDPGGVGLEATFTVVLNSEPTSNVTITPITSTDTLEITVAPTTIGDNTPISNRTLVFTPTYNQPITNSDTNSDGHNETSTGGWNIPQTVRVRAVIDGTLDGNQTRAINFGTRITSDAKYANVSLTPLPNLPATNIDSGSPQIILQNISAISFPENNTSTITFQIVLATLPISTVTISNIQTSDSTEGVVLPHGGGGPITNRTLVFTPTTNQPITGTNTTTGGWNVPQTVTIRSVDDGFDDGNITFKITIPTATGSPEYTGMLPYSSHTSYNNATGELTLTNVDNDTKGVSISPGSITSATTPLNVTEGAGSQTFTVVLTSDPCTTPLDLPSCTSGTVTINLTNNHTSQYTISPSSLTFTAGTWNSPQTVTVTAVNDNIDENNMDFQLVLESITGSGTDYDGFNPSDVYVRVQDNDTRGINLTLGAGYDHIVSSVGGYTVYNLTLNSQPAVGNTVTVTVSVPTTPPQEGKILDSDNVTPLDTRTFTFNSTNWNIPQTFRVKGLTGSGSGSANFLLTRSSTETGTLPPAGYTPGQYVDYNGVVATQNITNYHIGIGKKIRLAGANTILYENNATPAYFQVLLNQAPTDNVIINFGIDSSFPCTLPPTVGSTTQFQINTPSLTITPANWDQIINANRVEILRVNDLVDDGDVECALRITSVTSTDPYYNGATTSDFEEPSVKVMDDDTVGIQKQNPTPLSGGRLIVSKSGAQASLQYRLSSRPMTDVTLTFSDIGGEATYSPTSLTFTPANYNTWQTLTVIGNNTMPLSDTNFTIVATASSTETLTGAPSAGIYNALIDNYDATNRYLLYNLVPCTGPGIGTCSAVSPSGGVVPGTYTTTETGGKAYFAVSLRARPTANVTISISSSNTSEGTVSPASLLFTSANWNNLQVVTITGVDDPFTDGNQSYTIDFGTMSSVDSAFNQTIPSISVTNMDDD